MKTLGYCCCGLIIVVLLVVLWCCCFKKEGFKVRSSIDSEKYDVLEGFNDMQGASDKLAKLNNMNYSLINFLKSSCLGDKPAGLSPKQDDSKRCQIAEKLSNRYRGANAMFEHSPPDLDNTAYTEDKGKTLAMCLRNNIRQNDKNNLSGLVDDNMLQFVALHELSHIASESYDHGNEFWSNFKFLLKEAEKSGVYVPKNYEEHPQKYCGLEVAYNPYFDKTIL